MIFSTRNDRPEKRSCSVSIAVPWITALGISPPRAAPLIERDARAALDGFEHVGVDAVVAGEGDPCHDAVLLEGRREVVLVSKSLPVAADCPTDVLCTARALALDPGTFLIHPFVNCTFPAGVCSFVTSSTRKPRA